MQNLYSPLHFATKNGHIDMMEMLVGAGADVSVTNKVPKWLAI